MRGGKVLERLRGITGVGPEDLALGKVEGERFLRRKREKAFKGGASRLRRAKECKVVNDGKTCSVGSKGGSKHWLN